MSEGAEVVIVSSDVMELVTQTRQLIDRVIVLANRLERESDTALLAIAGWRVMPSRSTIFPI